MPRRVRFATEIEDEAAAHVNETQYRNSFLPSVEVPLS